MSGRLYAWDGIWNQDETRDLTSPHARVRFRLDHGPFYKHQ